MSTTGTSRAVVLARGVGTRMRAPDASAMLSAEQQAAAAAGHKALMPIAGRPFLDYALRSLAGAGIVDVALVVAPDHGAMRDAYPGDRGPDGVRLAWVVQAEPRGTADAVLAAADWAGGDPRGFLALNGDNLYPPPALRALAALDGPGLAGFDRDDLVASSNIPSDRIAAYAIVERDADGRLRNIVEKPETAVMERAGREALVSLNLWRFDARIFDACREIGPSARGEYELPSAVMRARERGVAFTVVPSVGPVLDVSRRGDVADVARRLSSPRES
jgi:dTDP-glucose pyrophosphorylase